MCIIWFREGRHLGLIGGGLGLGGFGQLQLVYYIRFDLLRKCVSSEMTWHYPGSSHRILYIRLIYLMRLLQFSNCGGYGLGGLGASGLGGGFSNYFSGGYRFVFPSALCLSYTIFILNQFRRSDLGDVGQLTDKRLDLNLNPPPSDYEQGYN